MAWLRFWLVLLHCLLAHYGLAQQPSDTTAAQNAPPKANSESDIPASTEAILLPELRVELIQRERLDQQARNELIEFLKTTGFMQLPKPVTDTILLARMKEVSDKLASIDGDNLKFMKVAVEKHGWLSKTLVGSDGAKAAWLMLQHSDKDREFQKQCLEVMKKLPQGEVDTKDIAYLTDRVLVGEGKEQIYGTQLRTNEKGELELAPLFEPATVDERRQRMGLGPLKEYMELVQKQLQG